MRNKYISFLSIRFTNGLQYRTAAYAGIITQFAWGFMSILMFRAFYEANSGAFPMEFSELASYIWLQQALLSLFMTWYMDNEPFQNIVSGNIAYELARPMDLYNMWFTKNVALRLSSVVLRCSPILIVAWFLPEPFRLTLPPDWISFIMFLITGTLGFFTVIAFCMLLYITTFYTMSPYGVRIIALSFVELLSGALIPLPFLPDGIRQAVELLPFASMQNLPLRIYSGNVAGTDLVQGTLLQVFWLITLLAIGKLWMNRTLTKVVVQGG